MTGTTEAQCVFPHMRGENMVSVDGNVKLIGYNKLSSVDMYNGKLTK